MTPLIIEERASTHVYRQKRMFTKEELETIEHLCVHEQSPYCSAACPLKLDTKAMVAAVAAGDFDKALALYDKVTPFPHILCSACEAPCEGECKLRELGEGVSIQELEKAALHFGASPQKRGLLRKKNKKAAIFGGDLFTLFLAGELSRKMYPVTVFCKEDGYDAFVRACAPELPEEVLTASAKALSRMDITFVWNTDPAAAYREKAGEFDLLCAAYDTARILFPGLAVDEAVMVCREQRLITGKTEGVLGAAFGAKKAALSADRLAQNLDPANTRGEEGSVETRLYTSLEGVAPSQRIPCTDRDSAMAEARRCIQCRCEECIKGCAYLQHYKKFPRILTREIYNNVSIIMGDHMMNKDGVSYVLVFKLSRFGRNAADVLNSLQLMQDFGVNLICVEDGIDSSKDAGKLMISVLSAVAEMWSNSLSFRFMTDSMRPSFLKKIGIWHRKSARSIPLSGKRSTIQTMPISCPAF